MFKIKRLLLRASIIAVIAGAVILFQIFRVPGKIPFFDKTQENLQTERPPQWAIPIEKDGLPNLHKVTENLYRGAQPTEAGIAELKKMGIKTIIDLREFHSDKGKIGNIEIGYEQEERNSDHLLEEGAAIRCNNFPALAYKIDKLLNEPRKLAAMKVNAQKFGQPRSALNIVQKLASS